MVPSTKVVVRLTADQRRTLEGVVHTGTQPAARRRRAHILLKADADGPDGWTDERIAEALDTSRMTVMRVRQQFAAGGAGRDAPPQAADRPAVPQAGRPAGGGAGRPGLLAGTRGSRPVDHAAAGRPAGGDAGGRVDRPGDRVPDAEKNAVRPWLKQQWVLPPKASAAFVANMEDVPDVYARPHDAARPVVCVDEAGKQLVGDVREPLPVRPGHAAKYDAEYVRGGVANLFMAFEPLAGRRHVEVTERKASVDFARFLRTLADDLYPAADRVVLVCDNLSTHTPAALYEAFAPAEARRLALRFEWHYTPEHGSRLNVAEMELSVLARQCLDRRTPDPDALRREVGAWQRDRDAAVVRVDWQFTTADARIKLKRLYPTIEVQ